MLKLAERSCYLSIRGRRTQVVKGEVCKTSMQRFESARRLQSTVRLSLSTPLDSASQQTIQLPGGVQFPRLVVSADRRAVDKNLRHGPSLRSLFHLGSFRRIMGDVDLFKRDLLRPEQGLCCRAIRTVARCVNNDLGHQNSPPDRVTPLSPVCALLESAPSFCH